MGTQAPLASKTNTTNEFGVIKKSTDYGRFRYMGGNRSVDIKHVKDLERQMERKPKMFASMPILVNENWYIVDGQHRFEAAKNLGVPVYYIMQQGADLSDARQLNIAQKRWQMIDFAKSYADSGRPDYVQLLRIKNNYPKLPLSTVANYLGLHGRDTDTFRRGEFQIVEEEDAVAALDHLAEVVEIIGRPASGAFASALWQVIHHEDYDEQTFIRKLKENTDTLTMATSVRACLRSIEEVYNRHNKLGVRLY